MKTATLNLLTIITFCLVLFSCSNEDDGIYFDEKVETYDVEKVSYCELETEVLTLVNNHRESIGLNKLITLNIISGVSDGHTDYMIQSGKISHDNFTDRAQELMNNANAKSVGENVAYGYTTAENVVNGWLNSESHREVIETASYTHFGISTNTNPEGHNYFTQIFIKI